MKIGVIGQGYVGKAYADYLEATGDHTVVRYGLEPEYQDNAFSVGHCEVVLIAVPTPSPNRQQDLCDVRMALTLVEEGKIAVIKSTMLPGSTVQLQREYPHLTLLHSPEFLSADTARADVCRPFATIIGLPDDTQRHDDAAEDVMEILPGMFHLMSSTQAEIVKYTHNLHGFMQIMATNLMCDVANHHGVDWEDIRHALSYDPHVPKSYLEPEHKGGRGAGGGCFIKDIAALSTMYREMLYQPAGATLLAMLENYNLSLLHSTGKSLAEVEAVYGRGEALDDDEDACALHTS